MKRLVVSSLRNYSREVSGIVSDIQKLCIHDGPGIVSNIFLKGCNLQCSWCHNVECISPEIQYYQDEEGNEVTIGKIMSVEEVVKYVESDKPFYDTSGGGVTISGGEPLLQPEFTFSLLEECQKRGIQTSIETNMTINPLEYGIDEVVDLIIGDIKIMDSEDHKKWTNHPNEIILENILKVNESGVPLMLRTPIIPGVNDNEEELGKICDFISTQPNEILYDLVPFNPLASSKYERLSLPYLFSEETFLKDEHFEDLKQFIRDQDIILYSDDHFDLSESSSRIEDGEIESERIKLLREESFESSFHPQLTHERAMIVTKVYEKYLNPTSSESLSNKESKQDINEWEMIISPSILRSLVFKEIFDQKELYIGDNELIVGERGPAPFIVPTFPELTCHDLKDLVTLSEREKQSYQVSQKTKDIYLEKIIPFWRGRAMRDRIFTKSDVLPEEYIAAYESGVFTEFLEQRAPGHTVCGAKIYEKGFLDIIEDINEQIEIRKAQLHQPMNKEEEMNKQIEEEIEELVAMRNCCEGIINYGERYSEYALELSKQENIDLKRKNELIKISEICSNIPKHAPKTFHEALQSYWFVHIGVITELNPWDAFSPGRLCVHLEPFYQQEVIEQKTMTRFEAKELLECFFIKFHNHPAPPKVGVTARESGTYMDFVNINIGGLDINGENAVGEVSQLLLEVISELKLLQPSTNIQISSKTPKKFIQDAFRIVRKGYGFPGLYNSDMIIEELVRAGKIIEDARIGGCSGCVETGSFGYESFILTGYFNLPKVLEITLFNGKDAITGKKIGICNDDDFDDDVRSCESFEEFFDFYFMRQLEYLVDVKIRGNDIFEKMFADIMPVPFLSTIIDDCIENAKDYNRGGARYHTRYLQGTGIGTLSDSLAAIKYCCFDNEIFTLDEMINALDKNFEGFDDIKTFVRTECPKYGTNNEYVDEIMCLAFDKFIDVVENNRSLSPTGGRYRVNMLSTTVHMHFGSLTGATADGRMKQTPISDGISPVGGTEKEGPTSIFLSAGKARHEKTSGTLLNMKLSPVLLEEQLGLDTLFGLVRTYFDLGGHHVQFNVVTSEELRNAQNDPESYKDLMVRVAGYSDFFCNLSLELQEEVILRTMHEESKNSKM